MVRRGINNRPFNGSHREKENKGQRRLIEERPGWDVLTIKLAEERRAALREQQQQIEHPSQTVVLVSCAAQKLKTPAPAADLYTSPLFKRAQAFAESHADAWYILSALHGLLRPERIIAPYNFTLKECRLREREQWAWRVICELRNAAPLRGMGIGQQLHFLINEAKISDRRSSMFMEP